MSEIYKALAKAQSEMTVAQKDAQNPHFKSTYATLASTWDALRGPLTKNGLAVAQYGEMSEGKQILVTRLVHSSGDFLESRIALITQKNDMQGLGSAWSYARRYGLQAIAGIAQDDDDGNAASDKPQTFQRAPMPPKEEPPWPTEEPVFDPISAINTLSKPQSVNQGLVVHFGYLKGTRVTDLTDEQLAKQIEFFSKPGKINEKTGKPWPKSQADLDLVEGMRRELASRKNAPGFDPNEELSF